MALASLDAGLNVDVDVDIALKLCRNFRWDMLNRRRIIGDGRRGCMLAAASSFLYAERTGGVTANRRRGHISQAEFVM